MSTYVGVDWGSKRWVVAVDDRSMATDAEGAPTGGVRVGTAPSMHAVLSRYREADQLLVDVPIGLPASPGESPRRCDEAARALLADGVQSSVFDVPCRDAIEAPDYETARERNEAVLDRSIGAQTWGIAERVHEVDVLLRAVDAGDRVRECHPEVAFAALADGPVTESKRTDDGVAERLAALAAHAPAFREAYDRTRDRIATTAAWKRRLGAGMLDDVRDALVLALTARLGRRAASGFDVLGGGRDAAGLPMEIVYCEGHDGT